MKMSGSCSRYVLRNIELIIEKLIEVMVYRLRHYLPHGGGRGVGVGAGGVGGDVRNSTIILGIQYVHKITM